MDLRHFLQGGSSGDPTVCLRDLGDDPQDREDPRRILPLSDQPYDGNESKKRNAGAVGIPTSGCCNVGSGDILVGYICTTPPEHHRLVYPNSSNTAAMYDVGTGAKSIGVNMVVDEIQ